MKLFVILRTEHTEDDDECLALTRLHRMIEGARAAIRIDAEATWKDMELEGCITPDHKYDLTETPTWSSLDLTTNRVWTISWQISEVELD